MPKLNALIAGSTGYIGIQLVKLLIKHPNINIKYLCGNKSKGKSISDFDKSIKNKKLPKIIKFSNNLLNNVDKIVFNSNWSKNRFFADLDINESIYNHKIHKMKPMKTRLILSLMVVLEKLSHQQS